MYHKVRITVASLVVMTICVLSSTGTLSYFTDTDGTTNNFTVGNASTLLTVYSDVAGENTFVAPTTPVEVGTVLPFYLQASNDGNIPVYQRFRVVIPIGLEDAVTLGLPTDGSCDVKTATEHVCSNTDYTIIYKPFDSETSKPAEYDIISNGRLELSGENSVTKKWPTESIKFGDISSVDQSLLQCDGTDGNNCVFGVNVYSDAIQTTGFIDALAAFADAGDNN